MKKKLNLFDPLEEHGEFIDETTQSFSQIHKKRKYSLGTQKIHVNLPPIDITNQVEEVIEDALFQQEKVYADRFSNLEKKIADMAGIISNLLEKDKPKQENPMPVITEPIEALDDRISKLENRVEAFKQLTFKDVEESKCDCIDQLDALKDKIEISHDDLEYKFRQLELRLQESQGEIKKFNNLDNVRVTITEALSSLKTADSTPLLFNEFGKGDKVGIYSDKFLSFEVHDNQAKKKKGKSLEQEIYDGQGDKPKVLVDKGLFHKDAIVCSGNNACEICSMHLRDYKILRALTLASNTVIRKYYLKYIEDPNWSSEALVTQLKKDRKIIKLKKKKQKGFRREKSGATNPSGGRSASTGRQFSGRGTSPQGGLNQLTLFHSQRPDPKVHYNPGTCFDIKASIVPKNWDWSIYKGWSITKDLAGKKKQAVYRMIKK